jgi:hypothetical protein
MRQITYTCCLIVTLCLTSCATVPRTDMPVKKDARGKMEPVQDRLLGIPIGAPYYRPIATVADKAQASIQRPAIWLLGISLPMGIVAFACALVLQCPSITKKCASVAAMALVVAVGATAWLLASMYMWVLIPAVVLAVVYGYTKMKGKGFRWHTNEEA